MTLKEVLILIPGRDITWKFLFYGCGSKPFTLTYFFSLRWLHLYLAPLVCVP